MREGISNPSTSSGTNTPSSVRNPRIVWTGAVLVILGLSVLLGAGEWFAAFDACVANPACNADASPATLETYLALMVAGVGLAVVGVTIALVGRQGERKGAMILWL